MLYTWEQIENMGYDNLSDFINAIMPEYPNYEDYIASHKGVEIKIRSNNSPIFPSVKKKHVKCKIFPAIGVSDTEQTFNKFCCENNIQKEDIIHISYNEHGYVFLVYNEN